jgi:hypothetical protein
MRISTGLPTLLLTLSAALLLARCGEGDQACIRDDDCGGGNRCSTPSPGSRGICRTCDPEETPYNALDDDCDPSTPDKDLDGDGENWVDSPIAPGTDCDDQQRLASSSQPELCGDNIDNDCDGRVDEEDCADALPPSVVFVHPMASDVIFGNVPFRIRVLEDTRLSQFELYTSEFRLGSPTNLDPPEQDIFRLEVDTTRIPNGRHRVTARAVDLVGRQGFDQVEITVEN